MLAGCTNPSCSASFRHLNEGFSIPGPALNSVQRFGLQQHDGSRRIAMLGATKNLVKEFGFPPGSAGGRDSSRVSGMTVRPGGSAESSSYIASN
jgi:hypothetical protein